MGDMADDAQDLAEREWLDRSEHMHPYVALGIYTGDFDFCPSCERDTHGECKTCGGKGWVKT